jgi:hypothetical protein
MSIRRFVMSRSISNALIELLPKKMILLMGPRQVGKTTLACSIDPDHAYYNYDIKKNLRVFRDLELKGIYDQGEVLKQRFLIAGSARLDIAKKWGTLLLSVFFHAFASTRPQRAEGPVWIKGY